MSRKISRKGLVRKLDAIFAKYIKARDRRTGNICVFCSRRTIEVCFHYISRYFRGTRWDEENCVGSCSGCNLRMEIDPYPFIQQFIIKNGQSIWDKQQTKAKKIVIHSNEDLKDKILYYSLKLSEVLIGPKN